MCVCTRASLHTSVNDTDSGCSNTKHMQFLIVQDMYSCSVLKHSAFTVPLDRSEHRRVIQTKQKQTSTKTNKMTLA